MNKQTESHQNGIDFSNKNIIKPLKDVGGFQMHIDKWNKPVLKAYTVNYHK